MPKKTNDEIAFVLRDWENREVVVPKTVLTLHLPRYHSESFAYVETLKERFHCPDKVISRSKKKDFEIIINLEDREFKYLVVFVKYQRKLKAIFGSKNYVATFYPTDDERQGEIVWLKNSKAQNGSTTKGRT